MSGPAPAAEARGPVRGWLALLPWTLGLLLAGVLALEQLERIAERLLRRDAEQTALSYAHDLATQTPGIHTILAGGTPEPAALSALQRFRSLGKVFRYRLFDPQGRLLVDSDHLHCVAGACVPGDTPDPAQQAATARVASDGQPRIELLRHAAGGPQPVTYTEAYVPFKVQGRVAGVIEVFVDQTARAERIGSAFFDVVALVVTLMGAFGAALLALITVRLRDRAGHERRLRRLAERDTLTGALNRGSFDAALQAAARRQARGAPGFAVLCLDIDHFKALNDAHGSTAGDEVLRVAGQRLAAAMRHGDVVARLGGDQFALLLQPGRRPETTDSLQALAQRLLDSLAQPIELQGRQLAFSASIGVARYGIDADSTTELMRRADTALSRAKSGGRGRFSFYDPAVDAALERRRALDADLRQAVREQALSLHYQPLYQADGRTLLGFEALLRWQHPVRGAVSPVEFIPLAEQAGLIGELGAWALRRACADAAAWPAPLKVAVNVSSAQFKAAQDLVDVVFGALDATGLAATRLELELTESLLIEDSATVRAALTGLTARGVQLALDDFGTGFSSLSYLWQYPLSKIKLDRSFTAALGSDPKVAVIVRAAIALARSLGLRVNAEGVETVAQMEALRGLGCDELQGFLLGRPAPNTSWGHAAALAAPAAAALDSSSAAA